MVVSSRSAERAEAAARELAGTGPGEVIAVACDVRHAEDCARLIEAAIDRFGRLDILINNAGLGVFTSIQDMSIDEFRVQIETNLCGVFYCSKAAAPHLIRSGDGWIVNIGSLAGRNAFAGGTGYNASKFGLLGMTEAMMLDLRHEGIRVSVIMPGSVATDFRPGAADSVPWALTSEDVAQAVLDLLDFPPNAHVSRIEMRPSQPPKK